MLTACAAFAFVALLGLGTWQLYRLQWKLDLIERVESRVHAAPVTAPGPERWPQITAASDEYRHVRLTGTFLNDQATKVQAVTELGSGYWVLTPLRTEDGNLVLINRGFILPGTIEQDPPAGIQTVTGLLRISEPGGGFLRYNDPVHNRWYSRDVQAIAAAHGLQHVAPYFIDADAGPPSGADPARHPVGGLTVIAFSNHHLGYAFTWYALALMVAGAWFRVFREHQRTRFAARV
jgi:surfeit locus 1 family protein